MRWGDESEVLRRVNMTPAQRRHERRRIIRFAAAGLAIVGLLAVVPAGPPEPGFEPTSCPSSSVSP